MKHTVLPRVQHEAKELNPTTDTAPIHAWIHPWLHLLGKLIFVNKIKIFRLLWKMMLRIVVVICFVNVATIMVCAFVL